ncbi:MAG: MBL fold metallo-hydrolase [Bacteroidia bacterium]
MHTKTYLSNPNLPTIQEGYAGNLLINDRFVNHHHIRMKTLADVMDWQLGEKPLKKEKKEDKYAPALVKNRDLFRSKEDGIWWMGHASFLFRINGITFLTDPCYANSLVLRRKVGIPCEISDIQQVDYLLLSHDHRDHLDLPSFQKILKNNPQATVLTSLRMNRWLKNIINPTQYQEAGWFQQYQLIRHKDLTITYLPAQHWCRRYLWDTNYVLWGSFMIETPEVTIYFAGDTGYNTHFQEIAKLFPKIDVCLMPIGAYEPPKMMKEAHQNPAEAVQAFHDLKGKIFLPMHYGTYPLADEPASAPIKWLESLPIQGKKVIPAVGERVIWT